MVELAEAELAEDELVEALVLRRAENVGIHHAPGFFTGKGWVYVTVGRRPYRVWKLHTAAYADMLAQQNGYPVAVLELSGRVYWLFRNRFYWDNDGLVADQVHALLVTRAQRQARQIERAQAIVAMTDDGARPRSRMAIPDDVKQLVWLRDKGRCCGCGSVTELQFDHIIPISLGGSDEAANLQILCGPCNRRKSDGLAV